MQIKFLIRYVVGFWICFSFYLTGWSQPYEEDFITDEIKSSIELTLETFQILDSLTEEVWPGWDADSLPPFFIGAPDNNAVFINPTSELPPGFIESSYSNGDKIYIRENSKMKVIFNGNAAVIDDMFFSVASMYPYKKNSDHYYLKLLSRFFKDPSIETSITEVLNSPEYYTSVAMHESFHFHHMANKSYPFFYTTIEPRYLGKPKVLAYSFIEGMILQEALYSRDQNGLNDQVCQFISVRDEKSKLIKEKHQRFEMVEEFNEGCAQYIQTKIQELLNEYSYRPVTRQSRVHDLTFNNVEDFELLDSLCLVVSTRQIKKGLGNKFYFYGQAQARILDRLCGNQWKSEIISENVFLVDLLKKYSNYDTEKKAQYLEQIDSRYNYDEILKKSRKGNYIN